MSQPPSQPVALVTGGARGIGEAICLALIGRGYRLFVADIDISGGSSGRSSSESTDAATRIECDVSDRASVARAIGTVEGLTDRLDVLVNNAGIGWPRRSAELSEADWEHVLNVNAGGMYRVSQASFPLLKAARQSTITSISSINAHMGAPGRLAYSASKAAIEAMTRVLAVEWAPFGIRVNAVAPGFTDTDSAHELEALGVADVPARAARSLSGRYAEPAEIGRIVAWLAGPESSYVSGQVIVADDGLLINGRIGRDALFE
jgi:NAD(P)-dependent dehydrogenase (short-subunit alcohol dehydrogenase family)